MKIPPKWDRLYVYFYAGSPPTCQSSVGMMGGAQLIYIGNYCSLGNTIHEMGHTVGLWHEHTRADRNTKVTVLWQNIQSSAYGNFLQQTVNGFDIGPYDYGSLMHYPTNSFSVNGQPTLVTIPPGIYIGQRGGRSAGDIAGVKLLYSRMGSAPAPTTTTTTTMSVTVAVSPTGPSVSADGSSVSGSALFQWGSGSSHTLSAPSSFQSGNSRYLFARWSDGGAATHTVVVPSTPVTYTAYFTKQNKVKVNASGGGSVSPALADAYYTNGTNLEFSATPAPNYCFASWSGLIPGTPASTLLTVSQPHTLRANFVVGAATVSPTSVAVPATGGSGAITVTISSGCAWTTQSGLPWIRTQTRKGLTGSGTVIYSVDKNPGKTPRAGTITVANQRVTFYQSASK